VRKYVVDIKASAQRDLDAVDNIVFERIDRKIVALAENPRPAGCKKLRGYKDTWRIRVGNWRVVYNIDDLAMLVTITRIAHRKEIYDRD
jgi:mRNA interferase RelE/StbE